MSWLEGKWIRELGESRHDRLFVAAVTSQGIVGVRETGTIVFLELEAPRIWAVEDFQQLLAD